MFPKRLYHFTSFWLCVRVPVPPRFHQHFWWSVIFNLSHANRVCSDTALCFSRAFSEDLNGIEYFWVCLLAICTSFIKLSVHTFHVFIRLCSSFRSFESSLYITYRSVLYQIHDLWVFSLSPWLVFAFFQQYLPKIQVLSLDEGQCIH